MKSTFFQGWRRFLAVLLMFVPMLFVNLSCGAADESEIIESLLENIESMGGEMTIVTKDGETIKVTIDQQPSASTCDENKETEEKKDQEKQSEKQESLSAYLPQLDCIEDVFRTLGVWESAEVLYDQLGNWAHVAAELGYNHENMYAALQADNESRLHQAKAKGLITYEQYQYKVGLYGEKALKWVNKIFGDTGGAAPQLSDYLPVLNSPADAFEMLGAGDEATAWHQQGHTWAHIAAELDYDMETMYAALQAKIQDQLHEAKSLGLITYEQYQAKVNHYCQQAETLLLEIF